MNNTGQFKVLKAAYERFVPLANGSDPLALGSVKFHLNDEIMGYYILTFDDITANRQILEHAKLVAYEEIITDCENSVSSEIPLDFKVNPNEKKLIQLRTKLKFYKKLGKKLEMILNTELGIEDYDSEIFTKINQIESNLEDHKCDMDLPDDRWDEDE